MSRRTTVILTDSGQLALAEARTLTGLNATDVMNRALKLYAFVEGQIRGGKELYLLSPTDERGDVVGDRITLI